MSRFQRHGVPDDVREVLTTGERVLAWGRDVTGRPVVASELAVYLPAAGGGSERVAYAGIARAVWSDPVLEVVTAAPDQRRLVVDLETPGELPPTVRERVMSTILLSQRVPIAGGRGALVIARRVPGRDDVAWSVVFDAGLDPADPALRATADAAIRAIRSSTGL